MTTTDLPSTGQVEAAETDDVAHDSAVQVRATAITNDPAAHAPLLAKGPAPADDTVCIFEVLEEMQRIIDSYREPDPQPQPQSARPLPAAPKADVELQS